jgi:hypothetical protein
VLATSCSVARRPASNGCGSAGDLVGAERALWSWERGIK